MSATNGDIYSNHNGTNGIHHDDSSEEERDHITDLHRQRSKTEEEEEVRDDVGDLDRERSKSEVSNGDATVPNRAFKNWYRRASVSKQLTTVEQKQLEDIPVLHEDQVDGSETNGHPLRPAPNEEEAKILEAISRRLSIAKPSAGPTSPLVQENVTNKLKTSSIRRGSVPQARMLKGNVKNRMAAFEKK